MNTKRLLFCFVLACTVPWSGCGGGSNVGSSPLMPADPCIQTIEFDCLSSARYEQEGKRIAETHRTRTDFSNQWGLGAIRLADRHCRRDRAGDAGSRGRAPGGRRRECLQYGLFGAGGPSPRGRDPQAFAATAATNREWASASLASHAPDPGRGGRAPADSRWPRAVGPPD